MAGARTLQLRSSGWRWWIETEADDQRLWEFDANLSRGEYSLRNLDGKTLRVFKEDSLANPIWAWKQDYIAPRMWIPSSTATG